MPSIEMQRRRKKKKEIVDNSKGWALTQNHRQTHLQSF